MKSRLKLRQPLIVLIIVLLIALQYNKPSRAYIILLVTFGGIFIISFLWARVLGAGIKLHREAPASWVRVGNHIQEHLTLSNKSLFPAPFIEFMDRSSLPDFNANRITSMSIRAIDSWTVSTFCKQRGLFHFGDAQIKTTDPLGIFEITSHASQQTSILVLPRPTALPKLGISSSGMMGEGQPRHNTLQQSIHTSTVREFAEGDSMRLIHWPTTARKNKTFVRLLENAPEGSWWIILDLDKDYMFGNGWDSNEEQSVALAASLASLGLSSRKLTGLVSNGQECSWLPPKKGDTQQWEILKTLALAKPGNLSLAGLFDKMLTSFGNRHSLLIITACTEISWIKSIPTLLKRGLIPTVFLMNTSNNNGTNSTEFTAATLAKQNIQYHIIPCGLIEPPTIESPVGNN